MSGDQDDLPTEGILVWLVRILDNPATTSDSKAFIRSILGASLIELGREQNDPGTGRSTR